MPRLSEPQRHQAIGMLQAGMDQTHVAISKLSTRYRLTGSVNDHPRSGRPHVTTPDQDRHSVMLHLHDRFIPDIDYE